MNTTYRLFVSLLLAFIFAIKIVAPICNAFKTDILQTETQKETDREGDEKDWSKEKFDVADLHPSHHYFSNFILGRSFLVDNSYNYFPAQYFAVPTPPPWC